jgi:hypothetical protein
MTGGLLHRSVKHLLDLGISPLPFIKQAVTQNILKQRFLYLNI